MFCHKDRTAVLIGKDWSVIGLDLQSHIYDLLFIEADKRPEHRHGADLIGSRKTVNGLAGHLSDTLSCYQRHTFIFSCKLFCNFHHIPAHDNGQLLVGAFVINIKLYIRKVYDMKPYRPRIPGHQFRQIDHFLFCSLAGIRRRMKINSINGHASLCDHVTCHRTVNSSWKQEHGSSVGSQRHSSRAWYIFWIEIDLIPDLYVHSYLRIVNIYFHIGAGVQDHTAQLAADLHGLHRIAFLISSGIHFKSQGFLSVDFFHIIRHVFGKLFKSLILQDYCGTDAVYAEDPLHGLYSLLIVKVILRIYKDTSHLFHHFERPFHIPKLVFDLLY